jgi:hypothetical protein
VALGRYGASGPDGFAPKAEVMNDRPTLAAAGLHGWRRCEHIRAGGQHAPAEIVRQFLTYRRSR